jgi:hypothetical protein
MKISKITERLIVDGYLDPSTIGPRQKIYEKQFSMSLIQEIVQNSKCTIKLWNGDLEQLVAIICKWSENEELFIFREIVHDCSFSEIQHLIRLEEPRIILSEMYWLQTSGISDSPVVRIGLVHSDFRWLIGFERGSGFEIAFYGSESQWSDLKRFIRLQS